MTARRIDTASRWIDASPSRIYEAFATASALESWLPPQGMTGEMLAFDFREGALYRMRLSYDEPVHTPGKSSEHSDEVEVRFVELVEGRRIVQAVTFETDRRELSGQMKITWTLEEAERGTEVTVSCENVPEGMRPDDHQAGLTSTLENLAAFTEGRPYVEPVPRHD